MFPIFPTLGANMVDKQPSSPSGQGSPGYAEPVSPIRPGQQVVGHAFWINIVIVKIPLLFLILSPLAFSILGLSCRGRTPSPQVFIFFLKLVQQGRTHRHWLSSFLVCPAGDEPQKSFSLSSRTANLPMFLSTD